MRTVVLLLPLALLLSGCTDGQAPDVEVGSLVDGTEDGGSRVTPEPLPPPAPLALRLLADGTLATGPPSADGPEEFAFNSFVPNFQLGMYRAYEATGQPLETSLHITAAKLTVHYRHDAPGYNPLDPQGFPEFAFLFGHEESTMPFIFMQGDAIAQQGAHRKVEAEVPLPAGGLVLPAGTAPFVWGGATFTQPDEVGQTVMLSNHNDTDTRFDLTAQWIDLPPETRSMVLEETGTLNGDGCTQRIDGQTHMEHPFDVPVDAVSLRVTLERTGGTGSGTDLDLRVFGPDGEVGASHTPLAKETVDLYLPNMEAAGPGTWTAQVNSCAPQQAMYKLNVELGVRDAPLLQAEELEAPPGR